MSGEGEDWKREERLKLLISVAVPQRPLSVEVITRFWSQQNVKEADSNGVCCERDLHLIWPRHLNNGWLMVRRVIVFLILPTDVRPWLISADFCSGPPCPRDRNLIWMLQTRRLCTLVCSTGLFFFFFFLNLRSVKSDQECHRMYTVIPGSWPQYWVTLSLFIFLVFTTSSSHDGAKKMFLEGVRGIEIEWGGAELHEGLQ